MDHYPNNSPSHFYVRLPQTVTLPQDYEVALTEIQFASQYENVMEDDVYFDIHAYISIEADTALKSKKLKRFTVPCGQYASNQELIEVLNTLTPQVMFHYNTVTKKARVRLHDTVYVDFSPRLQNILGLPTSWMSAVASAHGIGNHAMSINADFKSIFVYCDVVAPRPVGDVNVPLLRTLPPIYERNEIVHHIFTRPYYMPLKYFNFGIIEVRLTTDRGLDVNFKGGLTIATLHFRPRSGQDAVGFI
jgi:hypothetical protein